MKKALVFLFMLAIAKCCFTQTKGQMEKRFDPACVPKDILNKDYTLLVKIHHKKDSWVKKYTETMEKHYAGKFEIVPSDVSTKDAYPDSTKYRYLLLVNYAGSHSAEFSRVKPVTVFNPQGVGTVSTPHYALYIIDRQNNGNGVYTGLESAKVIKIAAFVADKLSGKEGGEEEEDKD